MANIILKDYKGNEQTYEGVEKVKLNTTDGGTQIFSKGDIAEDVQIDLDFTQGNQTINAPEGCLVKTAIIRKPNTLKPENIAKDVEIAGIVGTNEGGGGGGSSEPRMEYTYNKVGTLIAAKGIGLLSIPKYTLYQAYNLESLDLSECPNLTEIESNAFANCSSLKEVILPASVTSFGVSAFSNCNALESIRFLGTLSEWISLDKGSAFKNNTDRPKLYIGNSDVAVDWSTTEIPSDVTKIGNYTFAYEPITSITIPNSVKTIGMYAFHNCSSLTSIVIPDSVTYIGTYAFDNCKSLASIEIGNSVRTIADYAFRSCPALTSIVIPDGVTSIGNNVLTSCTALTSVTFGSGITKMGSDILSGCSALTSITFKEGMTVIGDRMMYSGTVYNFTEVTIPASIQKIGRYAFYNAAKLDRATFVDPDGWYVSTSSSATSGTNLTLTDPLYAASYLRMNNYRNYYWFNT